MYRVTLEEPGMLLLRVDAPIFFVNTQVGQGVEDGAAHGPVVWRVFELMRWCHQAVGQVRLAQPASSCALHLLAH